MVSIKIINPKNISNVIILCHDNDNQKIKIKHVKFSKELSCLCYITTLRFEIFSPRLWSVRISMFFRYIGRLATYQQKCNFILSLLLNFTCHFTCIYTHAQLRILKFQDSISKIRAVRTLNERRILKRCVVL